MGDKFIIKYLGEYRIHKLGYIEPKEKKVRVPKEKVVKPPRTRINDGLTSMQRYRKDNKLKIKARSIIFVELRSGRLKRQPCSVCGHEFSIEAHHDDYSKPLDIIWLCKLHHTERHYSLGI